MGADPPRQAAGGAEPEADRPPTIVNLSEVNADRKERPRIVRIRRNLGRAAGSIATGLQHVEVDPGKLSAPQDYTDIKIDSEDFAAVLLRLGERTRGSFTVSQVSAGRKNGLVIEVYGSKSSAAWNQERPDELWIGHRNEPNQTIVKDPSLLGEPARRYADLPGGHSEGYDDTFKQVFRRFYRSVADRSAAVEYPEFADGLRQLQILEKALE